MRKPTYPTNNPRKLINIRTQTIQKLNELYPKENTQQKRIQKLIEEVNTQRQKNTSYHSTNDHEEKYDS